MITYQTDLDIYPGKPPVVIKLSQYDTDFTLIFNLFASRGTFTISSGTTAAFREKKPDGNVISVDATLDITNKRVTVAPTEAIAKQITAIDGKCECELTLLKGSDELNTANFVLFIEKAPVDKDAVTSDSVIRELTNLDALEQEVEEIEERIEHLNPIETFEGRVINALGDSITEGWIYSGIPADPTWCEGMASILKCTVNNYGVSGTAICNGSSESFLTRLNRMTEKVVDLLIIFGGTNDFRSLYASSLGTINDAPAQGTNFYATFKNLVLTAINKYPRAQILVITPMRREGGGTKNSRNISLEDIVNAEIDVANYYGVHYYDFYHQGNINPDITSHKNYFTVDGLHPNQQGIDRFLIPSFVKYAQDILHNRPIVPSWIISGGFGAQGLYVTYDQTDRFVRMGSNTRRISFVDTVGENPLIASDGTELSVYPFDLGDATSIKVSAPCSLDLCCCGYIFRINPSTGEYVYAGDMVWGVCEKFRPIVIDHPEQLPEGTKFYAVVTVAKAASYSGDTARVDWNYSTLNQVNPVGWYVDFK